MAYDFGMTREQVRHQFPRQWLLVEATSARSDGNRRLIEAMEVVRQFPSGLETMKAYGQIHHREPHRELYVLHTDRPRLDIEERFWPGIRGWLDPDPR